MRASDIERHLPDVFLRTLEDGSVGRATLAVMEELHLPSERILDQLDRWFDPRRTSEDFVPFLAGWVDLDLEVTTGVGRLRELIVAAAEISRWRGTRHGLELFLETATGLQGFVIEEEVAGADGRPLPFVIRVTAPAGARPHERMVRRIIDIEKPVHVTCELRFATPPEGP